MTILEYIDGGLVVDVVPLAEVEAEIAKLRGALTEIRALPGSRLDEASIICEVALDEAA